MSHIFEELGYSETIEVPVLSNTARDYKFSDNESALQRVVCLGLKIHTDELGKGKSGRTILPLAEIKKGLLTLSTSKNKLVIKELPVETLLHNDRSITRTKPFMIDIPKCVLSLPDSQALVIPAGPPAGYTLVVTFFYRPFDESKDKVDNDGFVYQ